jgi:hypothetical protein
MLMIGLLLAAIPLAFAAGFLGARRTWQSALGRAKSSLRKAQYLGELPEPQDTGVRAIDELLKLHRASIEGLHDQMLSIQAAVLTVQTAAWPMDCSPVTGHSCHLKKSTKASSPNVSASGYLQGC